MKLQDLKKYEIKWGITPEAAHRYDGMQVKSQGDIEKIKKYEKKVHPYIYIDVWNMTPRLVIAFENKTEIIDQDIITDKEMEKAVEEAGGWMSMSGHYPINQRVERKLKKYLGEIKTATLNIWIDARLKEELERFSFEKKKTQRQIVEEALREYFKE